MVVALPGVAAVLLGRRAMRLGRPDGRAPAIIGAAIAVGFGVLNVVSCPAQLTVG